MTRPFTDADRAAAHLEGIGEQAWLARAIVQQAEHEAALRAARARPPEPEPAVQSVAVLLSLFWPLR